MFRAVVLQSLDIFKCSQFLEKFEKGVAQGGGGCLDEQDGGVPEGLEGEHDNENLVCGELQIRFGTKKSNSRTQLEKSKR